MPRHIPDARLLEHPIRREVLRVIEDAPGVRTHVIATLLDHDYHAVRYHVERLAAAGLVRSVGRGRLYARDATPSPEVEALAAPSVRAVYAFVLGRGEVPQSVLPGALALAPSTVSEAATRLVLAGLLERERQGQRVVLRAPALAR